MTSVTWVTGKVDGATILWDRDSYPVESSDRLGRLWLRRSAGDLRDSDRLALLAIRQSCCRRGRVRGDVGRRRPDARISHLRDDADGDIRPRACDLWSRNGIHELLQIHACAQREFAGLGCAHGDPRHSAKQFSAGMGLHVPRIRLATDAGRFWNEPPLRALSSGQTDDDVRPADRGVDSRLHGSDAVRSRSLSPGRMKLSLRKISFRSLGPGSFSMHPE